MRLSELAQKVAGLSLPGRSYVVFGSGPLVAHDIRETDDIDLLVSEDVYEYLKRQGWKERFHGTGSRVLTHGPFEAGKEWRFGEYDPTLDDLLSRADMMDGVPFASLQDVVAWKKTYAREKDLTDISLIESYLRG